MEYIYTSISNYLECSSDLIYCLLLSCNLDSNSLILSSKSDIFFVYSFRFLFAYDN